METLKFFYVERKYLTFRALKDYLCEDLIIKIIENNMIDKKLTRHINEMNEQ